MAGIAAGVGRPGGDSCTPDLSAELHGCLSFVIPAACGMYPISDHYDTKKEGGGGTTAGGVGSLMNSECIKSGQ